MYINLFNKILYRFIYGAFFLCAVFSPNYVSASSSLPPSCHLISWQQYGDRKVLEIGKIWSGTHTVIGAVEPQKGKLLVAYYGADRWVMLASVDADSGKICQLRLENRFSGWDSHNTLTMAVAADGSVHIVGNAHATPLFYARLQGSDIATVRISSLVGRDEDNATYPTFYRDSAGRLIFFYRSGVSGNGMWIADRWSGERWERLGPSFAAKDQTGTPLSAYPSTIITDQRGIGHMAVIWRRTFDVATNFAVGYAKTADFSHWSGVRGIARKGAVRPDQIDIVEQPGEKSGLLNNARIVLSGDGKPVLFYTRYGARGMDALMAAYQTPQGWSIKEIASSKYRTPIEGGGSLPGAPTFSVSSSGNIGTVAVSFPQQPRVSFQLDLRTLELLRTVPPSVAAVSPLPLKDILPIPAGLAHASLWSQSVTASGLNRPEKSQIFWYTQGLNRDYAWACTPQFPLACTPPPSPLLWVVPVD